MHILSAAGWSFLRMAIAYMLSLLFAIPYGIAAATSSKRERWMIPLIDILQSVPIVTFFPVAILFFITLGGGSRIGVEMASIFLIFTCQVWNLAFSVYETVKTFPRELLYLADAYKLPPMTRIRYFYIPAMIPGLVYNSMMSWANGWYFLIASEIFSVGSQEYRLPGLGTQIYESIARGDMWGMVWALIALVSIVLFMQFAIWNSLRRWAKMFEYSYEPVEIYKPTFVEWIEEFSYKFHIEKIFYDAMYRIWAFFHNRWVKYAIKIILYILVLSLLYGIYKFFVWLFVPLPSGIWKVFPALWATTVRIFIAYIISLVVILMPSYWLAVRKEEDDRVEDIILAFVSVFSSIPASAFFPLIVHFMVNYLGSMESGAVFIYVMSMVWYIIYNVLFGAKSIPKPLKNLASVFKIRGFLFARTVFFPSIFPPLITGSITGWGAAWNASVVAEYMIFSGKVFSVFGIGSFLVIYLTDNPKLMMWGAMIMAIYVVLLNKFVWQPLYNLAERRYRRGEW